jgi:hypothetical protein
MIKPCENGQCYVLPKVVVKHGTESADRIKGDKQIESDGTTRLAEVDAGDTAPTISE